MRAQVGEMLWGTASILADGQWDEPPATLESDEEGNYRLASEPVDDLGEPKDDRTDEAVDSRLFVFLVS
jgi:hypothetical protein